MYIYIYPYIYIYIYTYPLDIIEDAYCDTPPPPVSRFLSTVVTVDMEGVELFVKCKPVR